METGWAISLMMFMGVMTAMGSAKPFSQPTKPLFLMLLYQMRIVIISDHTRPVPSREILPEMLRQLRQGNPEIEVTLLVATGCHRGTTVQELERKLGAQIVENEKIEQALQYIEEHYAEKLKNDDIAAALHVDTRYLSRLFAKPKTL